MGDAVGAESYKAASSRFSKKKKAITKNQRTFAGDYGSSELQGNLAEMEIEDRGELSDGAAADDDNGE